jgi:choline dehydrogenase-like flavoprotein
MNLNVKAPAQNTYDVIVVGSGMSGGWAAKELCEKGLKVLLLDRGDNVEHPKYPTATWNPWDIPHRMNLTPLDKERSYVQARHYSYREDNKHYYINDKENPYVETKRFDWVRGDIVGGRSLLWARMCYRWSDLDFEANAKDGIAIDWPIRYKDIAPWYDYVESFVGISGNRDGIPHLPDGKLLPPWEMNCAEKSFKQLIEKKFSDRWVTIGRTANLTQPMNGRGACQARDLCHRGCPYGAYFSSNSSTIPAAQATGNLTLLSNSLVNQVIYDPQSQRAKGVEVINTLNGDVQEFYSRILFLNAATVATAFILLNSRSSTFPNGLGNSSDQVGRNLMDHHKYSGFGGRMEGFEDEYYSGRRPTGIYIPRFRNVKDKNKDFLRGYGIQGGASREGWRRGTETIGSELKETLTKPGRWNMGFTVFGECLPYQNNRITLNTDKKDKFGRNTISVDCEFKANERAMQKDETESMREIMETAGLKDIRSEGSSSFPGNANHEMGTARMGKDPKNSVLNEHNQMHDVKNIFITDGSCMVSSSCVNPSLTYMALTARACDYVMKELKRQNL